MFLKRRDSKYYNDNIRECRDRSYTWQELNCFFRPFAIAMGKERYHIFLLLMSMYMTHCNVENAKNLFNRLHPSLLYFENELEDVLESYILIEEYSSEREMQKKMEAVLADGYAVVVPYDLYVMPYSQNYLEQHHRHYILVKGYDSAKGIYYILDNMHNNLGESVVYSDFMIQYHNMYAGADAFHRNYDAYASSKPYFWKIINNDYDGKVEENVRKYLIKVLDMFISKSTTPYYIEWSMINGTVNGHMLDNVEQINQRNVYYGEFLKYLSEIGCICNDGLLNLTEELKKNWNVIKIRIMMGKNGTEEILKKNILLEEKWHKEVLCMLKSSKSIAKEEKQDEYIVLNELNAYIKEQDGNWRIRLSPDLVYDTWKMKDDACQILYSVGNNMTGIEVSIHKQIVVPGGGFHFGIILKSSDSQKILYGNSRNIHLVIFEPESENYEIYQSDYSFGDIDKLKVEFKRKGSGMEYRYYIMDFTQKWWKQVHTYEEKFIPEYAGVFVKSWERCECVVDVGMKKW